MKLAPGPMPKIGHSFVVNDAGYKGGLRDSAALLPNPAKVDKPPSGCRILHILLYSILGILALASKAV